MKRSTRTLIISIFIALALMGGVTACFRGNKQTTDGAQESTTPPSSETAEETKPTADTEESTTAPVGLQAHQDEQIKDQVAWLYLPGTAIDDPIVQAADNDYYLHRDEYGKSSTWGCYYADYLCDLSSRDALNTNTIIYSHAYKDESPDERKFTQLFHYCDIDFVRENPYMYLSIHGEDLAFQVAAVFSPASTSTISIPNPAERN